MQMSRHDDPFDQFIVLRTGFGNVHDACGYGYTYEDILLIASAVNRANGAKPGSPEHNAAWREAEVRLKRRKKSLAPTC